MAKPRSPWIDYVIYLSLRVSVCVLQGVSPGIAWWFFDSMASLVFRFTRRRRDVVIDNLRHAFPGRYSDAELDAMALQVYRHFASIVLEVMLMPRKVTARTTRRYVDHAEYTPMKAEIDAKRPVIVLTAHYGNWELSAHCLGLAGIRSHLVARPLDNPYLDEWLRSNRELTGHKVLAKAGDIRRMNEVLANNETLCTLGDQDAGVNGMFVDFFGRPASTHKAIARLAQRTGAVIAVVGFQKTGGLLEYKIRLMDLIRPEDFENHADATFAITQRFTTAIERMICLDPVQYFWLHRRWKHQPPVATQRKAA